MYRLPISEYPEVVPPQVVVRAVYPGANPKTISETVSVPLEQQLNGVENSLYTFSQATSDGVMTLTVTFKLGTDIDQAQQLVQNRVAQALPKLPEEVRRLGVLTLKSTPDLTMVVHLYSPDTTYDDIFVRNYATLQVKDVLARIDGVGQVQLFGSGDYAMRVWLDPERLAARGMAPGDVVNAIREQNMQVAAGAVGQQPVQSPVAFELQINTRGRLVSVEEFGNIVVKRGAHGETLLLKDVARVELGAGEFALRSLLNNRSAVAIPIFQQPGSNALRLSQEVRSTMELLKKNFPRGLDYAVAYDPTVFVQKSIDAVIHTLFEAILLVVLVVLVFLQTWRASIIPLAAVPVSLVGTFAVMSALGFSINALSLFGLVLAIGIVVDDAIVVVENVERNIALGLSPVDATRRAMDEVTGPIVATALVLCAVFIPTAFISGLSGMFYKQFAITIAISTVISAFNSLTLSPALSALLLRDHHAPKDGLTRVLDRLLGWFFRPFNRFFDWASGQYSKAVARVIRVSVVALAVYVGLIFLTGRIFQAVPAGFIPSQDKQFLICVAQLPDAASLDRTDAVIRRMSDLAMKVPGVAASVAFPGLSPNGFTASPNSGIAFITLDDFEKRRSPDLSANAIIGKLYQAFGEIQEARMIVINAPAVNGLSTGGGFKMYVEDRANLGPEALYGATWGTIGAAYATNVLQGVYSTYQINVPQIDLDVDRVKAKSLGVSLSSLYETLQVYLGSLYVNDFNQFGRTYQVVAQADSKFRDGADDIRRLKVRNERGQMVPIGTLVSVREAFGPDRVMRYNGYPAAEINGAPAPGYSSGQAEAFIEGLVRQTLPPGMAYEWTELTYQQRIAGNTAVYIFPLCILLVFLVLAAQYESLSLPLVILLIVPMTLLSAMVGVLLKGSDNNIFTQIGLIVLVGLACKNAILIVEFAREKQREGQDPMSAALEACKLRLRPILMTSIAFIAGVYPLVISSGAGAEMRQAMGVAVFSGMIGVTIFGLFLTPVFYVEIMKRVGRSSVK
jgi:multidrug efflux pump